MRRVTSSLTLQHCITTLNYQTHYFVRIFNFCLQESTLKAGSVAQWTINITTEYVLTFNGITLSNDIQWQLSSTVNFKSPRVQTALRAKWCRNMTLNRSAACMRECCIWEVILSLGTTVHVFFWTNLSTVRSLSPQLQTNFTCLNVPLTVTALFATLSARPTQLLLPDDAIAGNKWQGNCVRC
jgi:hypothetical protein